MSIVFFPPSPRAPFTLKTAHDFVAAPPDRKRDVWEGALCALTDPLLAAGTEIGVARAFALDFRAAVQAAVDALIDDGPDGNPQDEPQGLAASDNWF